MNDKPTVEVTKFSPIELAALAALLAQSDVLPWRFMDRVPRARVEQQLLEAILAKLTADGSGVLAAHAAGQLTGIITYEPLPWESKLFGRKAAALSVLLGSPGTGLGPLIGAALPLVRAGGVKLVTAKTYTTDIPAVHALQQHGFLLMDTMVDVTYRFQENSSGLFSAADRPADFVIRPAQRSDTEALRGVARAAFPRHFGRFHSDPEIGQETATRLYEEWIQACVEGWCDWVIVAENQGRIAGYSAWKKPGAAEARHDLRIGHYSIGAIHPDFQGRGLFKALTLAGMQALQGFADYIEGPTHVHNLAVQRGYLKLGWQIADSRHSFHQWLA
jgi:dTDP-4-amino-4,6-dideoxy-D-galactose acyltransferase